MAVAKMLKLQLVVHNCLKEKLLHSLQENGLVEIETKQNFKNPHQDTVQIEHLHELLVDIDSALDFLNQKNKQKKSFIETMIPPKIKIKKRDFYNIESEIELKNTLINLSELEISLQETNSKIEELNKLKRELFPWKEYNISPETRFKNVDLVNGSILRSKLEILLNKIEKSVPDSEGIEVSEYQGKTYLSFLVHKKYKTELKKILSSFSFATINLQGPLSPNETYQNTIQELSELEKKKNYLNKEVKKSFNITNGLMIAKDYVQNHLNKLQIEENFQSTKSTVLIKGWLPAKETQKVISILKSTGQEIDYLFSEPETSDNPPIVLENPSWLKPLEAVTTLYGYPSYWEKDPTPYLAFFFLLFFGISVGDVGYGIVIALLAWILIRTLDLSEKGKQFLKLFIYGGIFSIPAGVLTGSWFAVDLKYLPIVLQEMAITDPMKNPMPFLLFCLFLGFIHLLWGVFIEMLDGFRENIIQSLLDNLPILLFLPGFAGLLILAFYSTTGVTPNWSPIVKWFALVGAGSVVIFTNWRGKNIFSKIGGGLYNLYGMSAFIGDTISYARLMALGLATFLIGQAINIMAKLFFSLFGPIFGIIIATIVIVVGHLFNIVINLISAFIHPARLQYVEFFTKFFEGGGTSFRPFKLESKNFNIE